MCYVVYLATPLTLSEVRAMLPAGLQAEHLPPSSLPPFQHHLPDAQTVIRLYRGGCSCDLIRPRLTDQREDERPLRRRYAELGLSREAVIRALEAHRRVPPDRPRPPGYWPAAFAAFAAEHARNAGPSLYYLHFDAGQGLPADLARRPAAELTVGRALSAPGEWLAEGIPTILVR